MTLIVGRDIALLGGAFVHRFHKVGWRWPGTAEFFRLSSSSPASNSKTQASTTGESGSAPSTANLIHSTSKHGSIGITTSTSSSNSSSNNKGTGRRQAANGDANTSVNASIAAISDIGSSASQQEPQQAQNTSSVQKGTGAHDQPTQPAAFVQPLYISKVNTCFQLLLVGGCLTSSWYGWPPQEVLLSLGVVTGGTTVASSAAYARAYLQGKIK